MTEVPDPEAALWKVLTEYIKLKIDHLSQQIDQFESKWKMTFAEFAERCATDTLGKDPYDYEVESDYWEWEAAETLLDHYPVNDPTAHIPIEPMSIEAIVAALRDVVPADNTSGGGDSC
ncbi:MAG: hypothetical protein KF753_15975 [Caldilineaceae bacterium]|nr:hypothetical protein [Caldilineaceae bacterium]